MTDNRREPRREGALILSEETRLAIKFAAESTAKVMAEHGSKCEFTDDEKQTVKHLHGMYDNIGDGDASQGIEVHRETTKYVKGVMTYSGDAKKIGWKVAIVSIASWLLYAIWQMFKIEVKK